ncbi:MAG: hypothetical protein ACFCU8_09620 [Thermosynechococcaceae cyanobacterium]
MVSSVRLEGHSKLWFWAALSISLYFSWVSVGFAFSQPFIVQDDVRQHIVWMQRFIDPTLFPGDLIADYYQSQSPEIFQVLYRGAALLHIAPLTFAKLLPIPLGVIASAYYFSVCLELFPVPAGAFLSTLIFNQTVWLKGDVISATPRALLYPLFTAFLYYVLRDRIWPCFVIVALSFCYPTLALTEVAIVTVRLAQGWPMRPRLSPDRRRWLLWLGAMVVAVVFIAPRLLQDSDFGPIVSAAQMHQMPEYQAGGRAQYFGVQPFDFWMGGRSGLHIPTYPPVLLLGLGLPWVRKTKLAWVESIQDQIAILWDILLASVGLYAIAHLTLLTLYFPSRYTGHSFRFILCFASGIVVTIWLQALWQWLQALPQRQKWPALKQGVWLVPVIVFAIASLIVPSLPSIFVPAHGWIVGAEPQLYTFMAQQPQESLVASLSGEADNLPAFSERSTLVGREFAIPFHLGYYQRIKERAIDLIRAQYSPDLKAAKAAIQTYGIDFFLVDQAAFTPEYIRQNKWLTQYQPATDDAIATLEAKQTPALQSAQGCSVFSNDRLFVLDAVCLLQQP